MYCLGLATARKATTEGGGGGLDDPACTSVAWKAKRVIKKDSFVVNIVVVWYKALLNGYGDDQKIRIKPSIYIVFLLQFVLKRETFFTVLPDTFGTFLKRLSL